MAIDGFVDGPGYWCEVSKSVQLIHASDLQVLIGSSICHRFARILHVEELHSHDLAACS